MTNVASSCCRKASWHGTSRTTPCFLDQSATRRQRPSTNSPETPRWEFTCRRWPLGVPSRAIATLTRLLFLFSTGTGTARCARTTARRCSELIGRQETLFRFRRTLGTSTSTMIRTTRHFSSHSKTRVGCELSLVHANSCTRTTIDFTIDTTTKRIIGLDTSCKMTAVSRRTSCTTSPARL